MPGAPGTILAARGDLAASRPLWQTRPPMGTARVRRLRACRTAKRIALAAGATVLFLAVAELAARAYEYRGARLETRPVDVGPKQPGVLRIVVLGGSTVFGEPVPAFGFVAQLEHALASASRVPRVEILNLGRPGAGSSQVLALARSVAEHAQPDLLIVLSGHNEFLDRNGDPSSLSFRLSRFAAVRLFTRLAQKIRRAQDPAFVLPDRLIPYRRDSAWFRRRKAAYRRTLTEIAAVARDCGVPLVLCTAPSNLAGWPPAHHPSLQKPRRKAPGDPSCDAMRLYLEGRAHHLLGDSAAALRCFRAARDADPFPWRARSEFNEAVRSCDEEPGVFSADLERAFARAAGDALPGFNLFMDGCHPSPLGNAVIVETLCRTLRRVSPALPPCTPAASPAARLQDFLANAKHPEPVESLWLRLYLQSAKYCIQPPYYHLPGARRHLEQAMELAPEDWEVWANLATVSFLEDRPEEGLAELRRCRLLKGGPLRSEERSRAPFLEAALSRAGLPREPLP